MAGARAAAALCLLGAAAGQQASVFFGEEHPPLTVYSCSATEACSPERGGLTLDAQYRLLHSAKGDDASRNDVPLNCVNEGVWNKELCSDPEACARNCAVEGLTKDGYKNTYGVSRVDNGFKLEFLTEGGGSRVHLADTKTSYKVLALKNREISFDVDVSALPCGLSSTITLTPMDPDGEMGIGENKAGAEYGMGRCDASCTRSVKFSRGQANLDGWDAATGTGAMGSCCPELRLWEANKETQSMSLHACASAEPEKCLGDECTRKCDSMGCQFDPLELGNPDFFGPGARVDSTEPITVVTQFITEDGTDTGKLSKVRRFYTQHGQTVENARPDEQRFPSLLASKDITDEFCAAQKKLQGTSAGEGYLGRLGNALENGVVLTASVFETVAPAGPCEGADARKAQNASVAFSNFIYGEITSTCPACDHQALPAAVEEESRQMADVVKGPDGRVAPKPFVQTDAFRYIVYGAGILTLGLVFSACTSGAKTAGWRPPTGNTRGRR